MPSTTDSATVKSASMMKLSGNELKWSWWIKEDYGKVRLHSETPDEGHGPDNDQGGDSTDTETYPEGRARAVSVFKEDMAEIKVFSFPLSQTVNV